jgi:hypothetical protein
LEGIALGRHGSISILSLYIAPTKKTYLIDIFNLEEAAFSTTTNSGVSLNAAGIRLGSWTEPAAERILMEMQKRDCRNMATHFRCGQAALIAFISGELPGQTRRRTLASRKILFWCGEA